MNKLAEKQGLQFSLFTAVLLSLFASSAFANRPSAANESTEVITEAKPVAPVATKSRPEIDAAPVVTEPQEPSAVGNMMQQQNHRTVQTGDVMQLPGTELQTGETLRIQLLDYPRRGMSMDKVQNEYGQPIATSESIGNPPITHWTYSDRVVYFEYSTVLHVVAR